MSQVFQVKLPMRMETNKGGDKESMNLNIYRNLHFRKLSHQKNAFHRKIDPLLSGFPKLGKVSLHYEINPKSKGRLDTMNVGSIVDKYFSDTLVEAGVILDDDYTNVVFNSFAFGCVCPDDPHVLVTITEIEPRSVQPMRVFLDQNEIQQALESFITKMGLSGVNHVDLSADADGHITAEIVMGTQSLPKPNAPVYRETDSSGIIVRPKRGGRPLGSKNKPKEADDVATSSEGGPHSNGSGASESTEEEDTDTETDDETGSEDNRSESTKSNGVPSKNLFGDSDTESANTNDLDEEQDEEGDPVEVVPVEERVKKSSIFDE